MLIGIDGIPLATPKTGVGHYTFELARALALLEPRDEFQLLAHFPLDLTAERADIPPNLYTVQAPRGKRWLAIGLPLYARQKHLALFHGTNYVVPLWPGCPTVLTIHDLSLLRHPESHERRLVRRAKRRLPLMTRIATQILTDSESVKREICEHLHVVPDKIAVVPLAARSVFRPIKETRDVRRRLGVEDEFILFVGTLEPRKNIATLIHAFEELLRATSLSPQLVIAGPKGWLIEELFVTSERAALKKRVLFTGYLSDKDLRALYSSCRVFVYPSIYEGFGLPPLEAMACGAPVITSSIPAIKETVGAAARLIAPTDVGALTASLLQLLTDANARASYSAAGLRRAAEFTWERTAQMTREVYRNALRPATNAARATTGMLIF
ncbi:MAG: glycosyltransferase family 1 protein [bacterium]